MVKLIINGTNIKPEKYWCAPATYAHYKVYKDKKEAEKKELQAARKAARLAAKSTVTAP